MHDAEEAIEELKDQSALLNSEIAEHLSPKEAIESSDAAHEASVKADQKIVQCRDALHLRRTEVMTAMNFYRPAVESAEADLNLAEKKTKIEQWLTQINPMMEEVQKNRQMAIHIGNRARQAEAIRKKQEMKDRQKRKNERRAKWNKQLIQDLGSEVTLCVDNLQRADELKASAADKVTFKSQKNVVIGYHNRYRSRRGLRAFFCVVKIETEYKALKTNLETAKATFEDFKNKKDTMQQTMVEITRWGSRIDELESVLKEALGKDAEIKAQKSNAEIPGNLAIAGLFIRFMEMEGKTAEELFEMIAGPSAPSI